VNKPGRPRTSTLTRAEQLRRAKRRQRARQRAAGLVHVQLTVPRDLAEKIAVARQTDLFAEVLDQALDRAVIRVRDYPQLADLAWNRSAEFIPAGEAFRLYERNWRLVDANAILPDERRLIERLKAQFGGGVMNA
jgi:hypothetical protein